MMEDDNDYSRDQVKSLVEYDMDLKEKESMKLEEEDEKIERRTSKEYKPSIKGGKTSKQGVSDTMIIGLQKSNGSWLLDDIINSSLQWNQSLIVSNNPCSDITLWVTILALCYLEKYYSNTKELWTMVAKKAVTFIKKGCKAAGIDYDEITAKANQLLNEL